jgi:hypothetical protein
MALPFFLLPVVLVARRRRLRRARELHLRLEAAGITVQPETASVDVRPVVVVGEDRVWSQHLEGGPALPAQAHYTGLYAPRYMAPVRRPCVEVEGFTNRQITAEPPASGIG